MAHGLAALLKGHLNERRERRARRELRKLDPHILRDIGMNPDQVKGLDLYSHEAYRLGGGR